jgi:hypothetical protein
VNQGADQVRFIQSIRDAFAAALRAVLDGDAHAAREVLRGSAHRRRLLAATQSAIRARPWAPGPQLENELQYVADLGRVGQLVDELARLVVEGEPPPTPTRQMELAVLLDAGTRRLTQLLDRPLGPGLDPAYRGCGGALFEVADHGGRDSCELMRLCGSLAVTLLHASRHAARAA